VVKGAPQIMKDVSKQQGKANWNRLYDCVYKDLVGMFRVEFVGETLKVFIKPQFHFAFEIIQVILRPPKFELEFAIACHRELKKEAEAS